MSPLSYSGNQNRASGGGKMQIDVKQGTEREEEPEKVLVPVRRREVEKEIKQEVQKELSEDKQWQAPRRWRIY